MSYYAPILSTPVIAGWQGIFTSAQLAANKIIIMKGYKGKDPKWLLITGWILLQFTNKHKTIQKGESRGKSEVTWSHIKLLLLLTSPFPVIYRPIHPETKNASDSVLLPDRGIAAFLHFFRECCTIIRLRGRKVHKIYVHTHTFAYNISQNLIVDVAFTLTQSSKMFS